ncbi:MAG: HAMP domain-containing histidine kinase [Desulfobacteraceae bacterium]|nr:HAMP domain-containing histidine kinase [Desulfobacteraceae bacterium]
MKSIPDISNDSRKEGPDRFFKDINIEFLIHELKNPITVIETAIKTLLRKQDVFGALNPKQERLLNRALRNSLKSREMLHNLLEIGRTEASCVDCRNFHPYRAALAAIFDVVETVAGPVDVSESILSDSDAAMVFFARYKIVIACEADVADIRMLQDEIKFRQILSNLVKNALHYRKERLGIQFGIMGQLWYVDVVDDGPGIEQKHHQVIFQRYRQIDDINGLSRNGHGLGLAGARILARGMSGEIEVFSEPGKGTTFRFTLPFMPASAAGDSGP